MTDWKWHGRGGPMEPGRPMWDLFKCGAENCGVMVRDGGQAKHDKAFHPSEQDIAMAEALKKIQGPLDSAKALTDRAMGQGKAVDDCTPEEILARGVWHALHYIERYLTEWEKPGDRSGWEQTTDDFIKMSLEARG